MARRPRRRPGRRAGSAGTGSTSAAARAKSPRRGERFPSPARLALSRRSRARRRRGRRSRRPRDRRTRDRPRRPAGGVVRPWPDDAWTTPPRTRPSDVPEDDVGAAGDESSPADRSSARGPSTENCGTPVDAGTRTSTFWRAVPELHLALRRAESSIHQPAAGALARRGAPAVAGGVDGAARRWPAPRPPDGAARPRRVAAVGVPTSRRAARAPATPTASTRETARKPRPTAAAADAVHAAPSTRVRFTAQSVRPDGLRRHQGGVKLPAQVATGPHVTRR